MNEERRLNNSVLKLTGSPGHSFKMMKICLEWKNEIPVAVDPQHGWDKAGFDDGGDGYTIAALMSSCKTAFNY